MMRGPGKQRGVTLLISLIMLLVLTLFAVSMIRLSNTNLVVVGNMQTQRALEAQAQQAIETVMNSAGFYNDANNKTGCWTGDVSSNTVGAAGAGCFEGTDTNGYTVTLTQPTCVYSQKSAGYSGIVEEAPDDDFFEVSATATDPIDPNNSTATVVQGVKVTLPQGNCK
jgi:Tfp pilus assembly protein PilX